MFGTIQIDEVMFLAAVSGMKTSASEFVSGIEAFPDYQSDSETITQYKEQYDTFKKALTNYQNLLERDLDMIRQVGEALVETDNRLLKQRR